MNSIPETLDAETACEEADVAEVPEDAGSPPARAALGAGLVAGVSAALAACGGGTQPGDASLQAGLSDGAKVRQSAATANADRAADNMAVSNNAAPPANLATRNELTAAVVRLLLQAQFSAPEADIVALRTQGAEAWLAAQFNSPPSEGGYDWMVSSGNTNPMNNTFFWPQFADFMIWKQLITSPDQMRQRLALALSEMFVVSTSALDAFWPGSFMGAYWDVLVKGAFGNFRTLLEDITLNAAMGRYLNTLGNQKEDAATGRLPDENYAREVMQLFTIGLVRLNPDGTPQLGGDGRPVDSYTQADVSNLARVFTGYVYDNTGVTYTNTPFQPYPIPSPENARNRMRLDPARHSNLTVTFLGITIPANTPGATALRIARAKPLKMPSMMW